MPSPRHSSAAPQPLYGREVGSGPVHRLLGIGFDLFCFFFNSILIIFFLLWVVVAHG